MKPLGLKLETRLFKSGYSVVVGCDEVGRGALAGPVVAGAVAWKPESRIKSSWTLRGPETLEGNQELSKIQDSKLLSERQREELEIHIKHNALAWGVGVVGSGVIDKINIHQANLLAMERAVKNLITKLSNVAETDKKLKHRENIYLLIDGKFVLPKWSGEQTAVVDGDAKIFSIASASIIAKVYRDRLMVKLDKKFPGYELARHKGYGTSRHRQMIIKHGLSKIHRKTFCGNIDVWRSKTV